MERLSLRARAHRLTRNTASAARRAAALLVIAALTGGLLAAATGSAPASADSSATLVWAGATALGPSATSPDSTWTAFDVTSGGTEYVIRSQNEGVWESIAVPSPGHLTGLALSNAGEVYAVAPVGNGSNAALFWRYTAGAWSTAVTVDLNNPQSTSLAQVFVYGSTLVLFNNGVWSSADDGATWAARGANPFGWGRATRIGDSLYTVATSSVGRFSLATMTASSASLPGPNSGGPGTIMTTNGAPSDMWVGSVETYNGYRLYLWHSTDAGASWAQQFAADLLPAAVAPGLPDGTGQLARTTLGVSMGADDRVHVWGWDTAGGTTSLYEASRGRGPAPDWSDPTSVQTVATGTSGVGVTLLQRADGVDPGTAADPLDAWPCFTESATGACDLYHVVGSGAPLPDATTVAHPSGRMLRSGTYLRATAVSPSSSWRAVLVKDYGSSGGERVLRSSNGWDWEDLGAPTPRYVNSLAVADDGDVYVASSYSSGATTFYRYADQWYGPAVFDQGAPYTTGGANSLTLTASPAGSTLTDITPDGTAWTSTDAGSTWAGWGPSLFNAGQLGAVGQYVIREGGDAAATVDRWSTATHAAAPPTTPPVFEPGASWALRSAPGSTSDLWIAAVGAHFALFHSTDAGSNWSTVASGESVPAGLSSVASIGVDGRLHLYGTSYAGGSTTVLEASRGLGAAPDWTPVAPLGAVAGGNATLAAVEASGGVQQAQAEVWAWPQTPGAPCCPYDLYHLQRGGVPAGGAITAKEQTTGNPAVPMLCACRAHHVDPVDTADGVFSEGFDDLSVPGRGISLDAARTYSSALADADSPMGHGWAFSYGMSVAVDASGAATVSQENGSQAVFTPSGSGYTAAPRVVATLAHNGDGTWTFTRGARETFTFDSAGRLTAERDLNGYTTAVTRPDANTIVATDPAGRTLTYALSAGRIASVTDQASPPRTVTFAYSPAGDLTDAVDPDGGHWQFGYDAAHRMTTVRKPRHYGDTATTPAPVVSNAYDAQGRVTSQTDELGHTTTFDYTTVPGGTIVTAPEGDAVLELYSGGVLTSLTRAYGTPSAATWSYTYDPFTLGDAYTTDPDGHTTAQTFDASGNVLTATDGLGRTRLSTYDALNDLTSSTDALGVKTTYVYDAHGNLQSRSTPLTGTTQTQTTTFGYDPAHAGDVTSVTDPRGKTTAVTYDTAGDLASAADPTGRKTTFSYDAVGRRTSAVLPAGNATGGTPSAHTTAWTYDNRGHVLATTDELGHTATNTYDADGNLATSRDRDGNLTTYAYDAVDRTTGAQRADGTTVGSSYDRDNRLTAQTDGANRATGYSYDALGRVAAVTDPLNRVTQYGYDPAGNRTTVTDPQGRVATSSYDAANRLTGTTYSDGATPGVSYGYDADGRRTSMADGSGTTSYVWDSLGRATSVTNGAGAAVSYGYDLANNATLIGYPASHTVTRSFDDAGRLASLSDWLGHTTTFGYDADGNPATTTYPNGVTTTTVFDNAERVSSVNTAPTSAPNSPLASFAYNRDSEGQVAGVSSTGVPADSHSYSYTQLNQLQNVDTAATRYGYDQADNPAALASGAAQSFDAANEATRSQSAIARVATGSGGGTGTSTATAFTAPAAAGDQILVAATATTSDTIPTPPGYTVIGTYTAASGLPGAKTVVYRRAASGGESGVSFSTTLPVSMSVVAAVYRGVDPVTPTDALTSGSSTGSTAVTAASASASLGSARLVFFGGAAETATAGVWTAPAGMSQAAAKSDQAGTAALVADQTLAAAGSTGTRTAAYAVATTPTTPNLTAALVPLRPAAATFGYDAEGDRTSITSPSGVTTTLRYDQARRLTGFGTAATYAYNGDGLRTSKTVSATTSRFTWDPTGGVPLLLGDGANSYLYGPTGTPVEQISTTGTATYLHPDQLGSTRVLTDASGAVVGAASYDPYGNTTGTTGSVSTPLGWAGEYRDAESGLVYLRARYYDPATAQFLSRDPLVAMTGSAYGYAGDDPLNSSDPAGLFSFRHAFKVVGMAVAVTAYVGAAVCVMSVACGVAVAGAVGALAVVGTVAESAVVIGEDMEGRVIPTAQDLGATYYDPPEAPPSEWMENNRQWISEQMDRGCKIYDAGASPERVNYPNPTSPYYQMELDEIAKRDYPTTPINRS